MGELSPFEKATQAAYEAFERVLGEEQAAADAEALRWELARAERASRMASARTPFEAALQGAEMSQDQAAALLGVSQATVSRLASGTQQLSLGRAKVLADRLGIDYRVLLVEDGEGPVAGRRDTFPRFMLGVILGGWVEASVEDVAASVGLTPKDIEAWANGDLVLPETIAEDLVRIWLPGMVAKFGLA